MELFLGQIRGYLLCRFSSTSFIQSLSRRRPLYPQYDTAAKTTRRVKTRRHRFTLEIIFCLKMKSYGQQVNNEAVQSARFFLSRKYILAVSRFVSLVAPAHAFSSALVLAYHYLIPSPSRHKKWHQNDSSKFQITKVCLNFKILPPRIQVYATVILNH